MLSLPKHFKSFFYFLFFFFLSSVIYHLSSIPTLAQAPGDIFSNQTIQQKIEQEKTARETENGTKEVQIYSTRVNNQFLGDTVYNLSNSILCLDGEQTCSNSQSQSEGKPLSALGTVTQLMDKMYQYPPASGFAYIHNLLTNAGLLVKPVHAQGIGFAGLSPFLSLWQASRNIAYAVLIIIMVAIGFMIIFRMKIDPKTVISVQAALPKIILTLLLITFSYAIVGFLIDLMYLVMAIMISALATGFGCPGTTCSKTAADFQTYFMTADIGDLFKTVFSAGFSTFDDFIRSTAAINIIGSGAIGAILAALAGAGGWWGLGGITGIFVLILLLGLLFTFIRLLMLLLNSYIQLLIAVILGPLQLLFEAIPGKSAFSGWILNIIANLSVFPATVAILMFGEYLTQLKSNTAPFAPPLVGIPFTSSSGMSGFTAFLGLGVVFLAPTLVAQIKKAFHPKPAIPMTAGTAFAPLTGAMQTGMGAASQFYYLQQMPWIGQLLGGPGHCKKSP